MPHDSMNRSTRSNRPPLRQRGNYHRCSCEVTEGVEAECVTYGVVQVPANWKGIHIKAKYQRRTTTFLTADPL